MRRVTPFDARGYYYYYGGSSRARVWNVVDRDALAIINAFATPPTAARAALISSTVSSLKSSGVWPLLDVLYMFAAADSQAALINWKNPGTFDATLVNAPAFVADQGFTGDGATSYVATGFTPSAAGGNFQQDSAHISARSLTSLGAADINQRLVGVAVNTANRVQIIPWGGTTNGTFIVNDNTASAGGGHSSTLGLFATNRAVAGTKTFWRNGTSISSAATASTGNTDQAITICFDRTVFSSLQTASFSAGGSIDQAAYHAAELAYMQAVGAA